MHRTLTNSVRVAAYRFAEAEGIRFNPDHGDHRRTATGWRLEFRDRGGWPFRSEFTDAQLAALFAEWKAENVLQASRMVQGELF